MLDLTQIKKVHFTGIKGVGMTALACIAKDFGMQITGSDVAETFVTDCVLEKKEINWTPDFSAQKIEQTKPDLLIYTVAHSGEENEEVIKARHLNISTLSQAQALGIFSKTKKSRISIAGVGGKTTTTAWLATCLEFLNLNPSYMVGVGFVPSLNYSGKYNPDGDIFLTEADEYKSSGQDTKPKFFYQDPQIVIIPNLSFDHPDVYKSQDDTLRVFKDLVEKIPSSGALIINTDCRLNQKLIEISDIKAKVFEYGEKDIENDQKDNFIYKGEKYKISVQGKFNKLNAVAIILTLKHLGINLENIKKSLSEFKGLERRFQKVYEKNSTLIYDDYAHHPDEIRATLASFKSQFPEKKLFTIFQPHTFSRTKSLFKQFSESFTNSDHLILLPIFASAREAHDDTISSHKLNEEINKISSNSVYLQKDEVLEFLKSQDLENAIILTMGAGDVYKLADEIKTIL